MQKHNQIGAGSGLVFSLILAVVLLIAAIGFGAWAYTSRQDYKDNVEQKVQVAVDDATQKESALKDKQYAEESKNPLKTYRGPEQYGALNLAFPKTWSGYVDDTGSGSSLVNGYFYPNTVPTISGDKSTFATRVQVLSQDYKSSLSTIQSQQQSGKVQVSAYALPKLPKVVGVRVKGQLDNKKDVDLIVLPLRSYTVKLWTEGNQFGNDFNKYIVPNFTFSP